MEQQVFHLVGHNHPSTWRLIDCLKQEDATTSTLMMQDELGNPPKKKTMRIYFQLQQRLRNLCIQYGEGTRSLEE
jgi:D-hexose-6-phosphate mutarotase